MLVCTYSFAGEARLRPWPHFATRTCGEYISESYKATSSISFLKIITTRLHGSVSKHALTGHRGHYICQMFAASSALHVCACSPTPQHLNPGQYNAYPKESFSHRMQRGLKSLAARAVERCFGTSRLPHSSLRFAELLPLLACISPYFRLRQW
jgi:hypothetical protein